MVVAKESSRWQQSIQGSQSSLSDLRRPPALNFIPTSTTRRPLSPNPHPFHPPDQEAAQLHKQQSAGPRVPASQTRIYRLPSASSQEIERARQLSTHCHPAGALAAVAWCNSVQAAHPGSPPTCHLNLMTAWTAGSAKTA